MSEYEQIFNEVRTSGLKTFKKWEESTEWTGIKQEGHVRLSSQPYPDSKIDIHRGEIFLSGADGDKLSEKYANLTADELMKLDSTQTFEFVHIEKDAIIRYAKAKLTWPIWDRDFIFASVRLKDDDGSFYVLNQSFVTSKYPENPKKCVRGTIDVAGLKFTNVEGGVKVVRIVHINPNGDLPGWLVSQMAGKQVGGILNSLKNFI